MRAHFSPTCDSFLMSLCVFTCAFISSFYSTLSTYYIYYTYYYYYLLLLLLMYKSNRSSMAFMANAHAFFAYDLKIGSNWFLFLVASFSFVFRRHDVFSFTPEEQYHMALLANSRARNKSIESSTSDKYGAKDDDANTTAFRML